MLYRYCFSVQPLKYIITQRGSFTLISIFLKLFLLLFFIIFFRKKKRGGGVKDQLVFICFFLLNSDSLLVKSFRAPPSLPSLNPLILVLRSTRTNTSYNTSPLHPSSPIFTLYLTQFKTKEEPFNSRNSLYQSQRSSQLRKRRQERTRKKRLNGFISIRANNFKNDNNVINEIVSFMTTLTKLLFPSPGSCSYCRIPATFTLDKTFPF